jgi:glycosyltransferase involved in cell wall biosynthesis
VETHIFTPFSNRKHNKEPIYLYVGRIAVEKNIEAFLSIKLVGRKIVVGAGPLLSKLKMAYPDVIFLGEKSKNELPEIYNQADVFVFPSRTDTFGLVLLEAMACGVPVAAFPAAAPIDVIGNSKAGLLSENLAHAVQEALKIPRKVARAHAESYSWEEATRMFLKHQAEI